MKILIISQWYLPEPVEIISEMAETLQQSGHEVSVLTGFPNWPSGKLAPGYRIRLWQREKINGVPVTRVPLYPDHSRSPLKRAANFMSFVVSLTLLGPWLAPRAEVIHVFHPPLTMGWAAWVIGSFQRIPFTYEIQDMWPETLQATGMMNNNLALKMIGRLANWVYRRAAAIRVISPGFKANLVGKGVDPQKIHTISNWVDTQFFRPLPRDEVLAHKLGLAGRFNIIYAGTIGLAQGLETVLEAAVLLRDIPDLQFVFVGDGVDLERLRTMAAEREIHNVKFLGRHPVEMMPRLYALADVLFLHLRDDPLFRITIPHKIFTYLASGRPVLAAVAGDASRVVQEARAGLVSPPSNPSALAEAARNLYQLSPAELSSLGENGRRAAMELYNRQGQVARIEKMILGVAAGK